MSVNYAAGLSPFAHKGKCGQPEFTDTKEQLKEKVDQLASLVKESKHCVVLTGAGISTSTGIPDFRGPAGVWTLEEKGLEPKFATTFDNAHASFAHMSLVALEKAGIVKHLITQNVDGLHLRSGFPRASMSILHGDMFTEQCDKCSHMVIRRESSKTMGLKRTGASCQQMSKRGNKCRGKMRDTILDWEDALPDEELDKATDNSRLADVYLVLGSSLQIIPAGNLPLQCKKSGGKIVTVNLQHTKHHKKTDLVINSYIDDVMKELCDQLGVVVPLFTAPTLILTSTHKYPLPTDVSNISVDKNFLPPTAKSASDGSSSTLGLTKETIKTENQVAATLGVVKRKCHNSLDWKEGVKLTRLEKKVPVS
ncbi:NAD-dependent protein deacylase sirtuin-6-like [Watersipora subatra]|uniref:NAD-dependent protein deacylase sirtuin-6-like n=1 Tax=Watersipora subatra TaxID=2589382 RepID=UPI00355B6C77